MHFNAQLSWESNDPCTAWSRSRTESTVEKVLQDFLVDQLRRMVCLWSGVCKVSYGQKAQKVDFNRAYNWLSSRRGSKQCNENVRSRGRGRAKGRRRSGWEDHHHQEEVLEGGVTTKYNNNNNKQTINNQSVKETNRGQIRGREEEGFGGWEDHHHHHQEEGLGGGGTTKYNNNSKNKQKRTRGGGFQWVGGHSGSRKREPIRGGAD